MSSSKEIMSVPLSPAGKSLTKVLGAFEEMVGGREDLAAALSTIELTEKEGILVGLLEDSARSGNSLFDLCRAAGVPPHSLMGLYRQAMTQQTERILYGGLPKVIEGVVSQAREGKAVCPLCGNDETLGKEGCELCHGRGYVWRPASLEHQELVMDAAKMLPKGGGVNVKVDQRVGVQLGNSLFDKFVKATDESAYAIDAEVIAKEDAGGPEGGRADDPKD